MRKLLRKINKLLFLLIFGFNSYSQKDTSFLKNDFNPNGTVYIQHTINDIFDVNYSYDIFYYRDTVTNQKTNGVLINSISKQRFSISNVIEGRPVEAELTYDKSKLIYLSYFFKETFVNLSLSLKNKGNIKYAYYSNPTGYNITIKIDKRKYKVIVINNTNFDRNVYKTKQIDNNIDFVFSLCYDFGLMSVSSNKFTGDEYKLSKEDVEKINLLRK